MEQKEKSSLYRLLMFTIERSENVILSLHRSNQKVHNELVWVFRKVFLLCPRVLY